MADVKAVVAVDLYRWHDEFGNTDSPVNEATRGEKVTVSAEEFKRAQAMTPVGLEKPGRKSDDESASDETPPAEDTEPQS